MALFYFKVGDNDGAISAGDAFEFPDFTAAVGQAKMVLAEMALDGLPQAPERALEIEVQNADHFPIVRLLLELKIDYLAAPTV